MWLVLFAAWFRKGEGLVRAKGIKMHLSRSLRDSFCRFLRFTLQVVRKFCQLMALPRIGAFISLPLTFSLKMQDSVIVNEFILKHAWILRGRKTSQKRSTGNDVEKQAWKIIYPVHTNNDVRVFWCQGLTADRCHLAGGLFHQVMRPVCPEERADLQSYCINLTWLPLPLSLTSEIVTQQKGNWGLVLLTFPCIPRRNSTLTREMTEKWARVAKKKNRYLLSFDIIVQILLHQLWPLGLCTKIPNKQ